MNSDFYKKNSYLKIFASYYRPHIHLFILDMFCALLVCLIDLAFPTVSRYCMQHLLPDHAFGTFFAVMAILAGAYVLKGILYYIITYWGHLLGAIMETDMRRDLFAQMQRLSFSFYDRNRTGQLMSRVTGDLFEITELAHHGPEDLFISCVTILGAFSIMLSIRWELAVVVFAVIPVFLVYTAFTRRKMMDASAQLKIKLAGVNAEVESAISGMRTAKAFANEESERVKFGRANGQFLTSKRGYYKVMALYQSGMEFFMGILSVLVIAIGGWMIMIGKMDFIDLTTFALYITTFITPIRKLSAFVEQYMQGMAGFKRFTALMREEPEIQDAANALPLGDVKGHIQLKDVSFCYQDDEKPVLSHVNMEIHPGETIAVVGPSGGGKTTLCQLIPRFYDVTDGSLSIDGKDVRTLQQDSLHQAIGIVQQDVFLFSGTIRENILYGKPDASPEEVVEAAKRAEIYEDIMEMPQGFDTQVGERGVLLSGGQKQRISIARIFLKNPPVLILDEATSALDTITEARIQHAFDELTKGRTTLIIAHRLSTIRNASRIVLIDDAGIKEEGTHRALMEKDGEYAALYRTQQLVES